MIKSEFDIEKLVASDIWMMDVLRTAEWLDLPDWWIGANLTCRYRLRHATIN